MTQLISDAIQETEQGLPIKNRTFIQGDNFIALRRLADNFVDMIYLDPPFNKGREWEGSTGSQADDISWSDFFSEATLPPHIVEHINSTVPDLYQHLRSYRKVFKRSGSNYAYLMQMLARLVECKRILRPTGTLFFHCDHTMQAEIKLLLDYLFGKRNRINTVTIHRGNGKNNAKNRFGNNEDFGLLYGNFPLDGEPMHIYKNGPAAPFYADQLRTKPNEDDYWLEDDRGKYKPKPLKDKTYGTHHYDYKGHKGPWRRSFKDVEKLEAEGRIYFPANNGVPTQKTYFHENDGSVGGAIWLNGRDGLSNLPPPGKRTGYRTEKSVSVMERCIKSCTQKGDLILDPFCGTGTTAEAAERLDRNWIMIDENKEAFSLIQDRLNKAVSGNTEELDWIRSGLEVHIVHVSSMPKINTGVAPKPGWVYALQSDDKPGLLELGHTTTKVDERRASSQGKTPYHEVKAVWKKWHETPRLAELHLLDVLPRTKYGEFVCATLTELNQAWARYKS